MFFLDSQNRATDLKIGPNAITVSVEVNGPGTLVINQNYHAHWRPERERLESWNGLLAVRLTDAGTDTVRLRYVRRSFRFGLGMSLTSAILLFLVWWRIWRPGHPELQGQSVEERAEPLTSSIRRRALPASRNE